MQRIWHAIWHALIWLIYPDNYWLIEIYFSINYMYPYVAHEMNPECSTCASRNQLPVSLPQDAASCVHGVFRDVWPWIGTHENGLKAQHIYIYIFFALTLNHPEVDTDKICMNMHEYATLKHFQTYSQFPWGFVLPMINSKKSKWKAGFAPPWGILFWDKPMQVWGIELWSSVCVARSIELVAAMVDGSQNRVIICYDPMDIN